MRIELTGRRLPPVLLTRAALAVATLTLALGLGACTTVEGTNAMGDFGTFEREVMTSTLQGLGAVPKDEKEPQVSRRGPLVLPKANAALPPPATKTAELVLPEDRTAVQIDASGLTEADMVRLRNARVVDLRTKSGRPLTTQETSELTARFRGAQVKGKRALTLPPDEYFTVVNGQDLVCLSELGDLVPLNDPKCPSVLRRALSR